MEQEALKLQDKGEYKIAEELFRKCLAERQRTLAADHIEVLAAMNNLANLLHERGENTEAEALHRPNRMHGAPGNRCAGQPDRKVPTPLGV